MSEPLKNFIDDLDSIHIPNEEKIDELKDIDSVAIVGSTCAGKTTMADAIRNSDLFTQGIIDIPIRYITRPTRAQDNTIENMHVTAEEFKHKVDNGEIGLHWVRKMEGNREEQYGFHRVPSDKFPIYSGNNALFNNSDSVHPKGILNHSLLVGVYAPDKIRGERLLARSPDLFRNCPDEVEYRLGDSSDNMLPYVHVIIDNHGISESKSSAEIVRLNRTYCSNQRIFYTSLGNSKRATSR